MSRPNDEYPTPVIELKFDQALKRIRRRRRREAEKELVVSPPTPPCPIREMTDEEEEEYNSRTFGSTIT